MLEETENMAKMEEMKELENRVLFEETGILEETEELKELERQGEDWVFWGGGCRALPNSLNMSQAR